MQPAAAYVQSLSTPSLCLALGDPPLTTPLVVSGPNDPSRLVPAPAQPHQDT